MQLAHFCSSNSGGHTATTKVQGGSPPNSTSSGNSNQPKFKSEMKNWKFWHLIAIFQAFSIISKGGTDFSLLWSNANTWNICDKT